MKERKETISKVKNAYVVFFEIALSCVELGVLKRCYCTFGCTWALWWIQRVSKQWTDDSQWTKRDFNVISLKVLYFITCWRNLYILERTNSFWLSKHLRIFGSLCFLHLDLSYMEFLERATMVNRTSSGSRSMKVLQTPKASYSQAHKTMSNHKEKYWAEFYFPFILSNITSRNVSSEVFPCTMGKAFRPSKSAGGNSSKTVKCLLNKSSSGGKCDKTFRQRLTHPVHIIVLPHSQELWNADSLFHLYLEAVTDNKCFVVLKTCLHKSLKIIYAILCHTNLSLSFLSTGLMHNTYSL